MALADHVFNAGQVISVIDNKVEGLQMEVVELKVGSEPEVVAAVKLQAFEVQALTDHLKVELEEVSHRQESLELDLDNSQEDHFKILHEDSNVPMESEQPFDDSLPPLQE
ncbi:hypothetical protein GW17_00050245 [Ensete ventricosum]|nr:hypothetical protein GW17_00050245 [Ensete ventricosum]